MSGESRNKNGTDRNGGDLPSVPRRSRLGQTLTLVALGALSVGTADCAQTRAPIDQTQPNILSKSFFVGEDLRGGQDDPEFYINNFVVSAPASQTLVPVGTYDEVDRIRFEIQENFLIARKAYEFVTGSDGHGVRGPTNNGNVVAVYRIISHFDVRPAYSPITGEELNIITENTTDRPWFQRSKMRVDWSQNLVDNPDWGGLFYGQIFGDLSFQPVAYSVTDPQHPDAPNTREMEPSGNNPGGYFDVTSKWLVSPETNRSFGFSIPTCLLVNFFSGSDSYDCNPQETTIRTSFRRIGEFNAETQQWNVEGRDFEPLELTRAPFDLVGGPRATRSGFDPNYGNVDANFHRYAMIHNVWQRSHLSPVIGCTSAADENNDGTADACAAGNAPGSQCDMVMERCTIPYNARTIRPIVYYINPETPPELQNHVESEPDASGNVRYFLPDAANAPAGRPLVTGASEEIMASWNLAIMSAIANAREVECRRLGGDRTDCHNRFFDTGTIAAEDGAWLAAPPRALNGPAVILCHNPVRATDSQTACRETGYSVRLGDIRYNHLTYVNGNSRAPFGGIAHWGYDPLTGEVISNGATNMARSVEYAAGQQRDYIRLILSQMTPPQDNLSLSDYVNGAPTAVLAQHIRNPASVMNGTHGTGLAAMSQIELDQRSAAVDTEHGAMQLGGALPNFGTDIQAGQAFVDRELTRPTTQIGGTSRTQIGFQAASRMLQNTTLETDMIDQNALIAADMDPTTQIGNVDQPATQALLDRVSPLRRMDPEFTSNLHSSLMRSAEARGFCFQDMGAPAMIGSVDLQGVARWFLQKYRGLSPEARSRRILQDLRIEAYKGIAMHEVGHSLGLYHVPVSSYDSMNYNPQYWQLRTNMGRAQDTCRPACSTANPNCPSIRATDRNTDNCMGPRYIDPETDAELGVVDNDPSPHAGVNYFANTSVMEYQWERFDETVGIGAYDHYAMGILYGRVLETMEGDTGRGGQSAEDQARFAPRLATQLSDQDRIVWADPSLTTPAQPFQLPIHYTELAREMAIFDPARCRDATPEEKERYRWRIVDGKLCAFGPRDHAAMVDFETSDPSGAEATSPNYRTSPSWRTREGTRTGSNNLRWGYRVAWDIGTGYPHINYFDQGADLYEVTQSMIRKYELGYPAQYFRRGQREWNSWGISSGIASRLFRNIRGYHWNTARNGTLYRSIFNAATYNAVASDDNYFRPYLVAGTAIFDFFAGVMLRPDVGGFRPATDRSTPELRQQIMPGTTSGRSIFDATDSTANPALFAVGVINGRFISPDFDNNSGGSWDYHHWLLREGAHQEKPYAAIALTDTRPTFSSVTRNLYLDGREFQVNFYTDMPQAYDRLLGGMLSEDWAAVAMHVDRTTNATSPNPETELVPMLPRLWDSTVHRYGTDNTTVLTNPTHAGLVFPNVGYRQELPAVIYSMIFSSLNSDLNTIHKMRIWTEGGSEAVDIPESERIRFVNPESGIRYVARRYGPDPGYTPEMVGTRIIDRGIASRMIQHANALLLEAYATDGMNPDGTPRMRLDASGNLMPALPAGPPQAAALTAFHNYANLIDATRNVARHLGYGQLR